MKLETLIYTTAGILLLIVILLVILLWKNFSQSAQKKSQDQRENEEFRLQKKKWEEERRTLIEENIRIENEREYFRTTADRLSIEYKYEKEHQEEKITKKIAQLESTREHLQHEKTRIVRKEEEATEKKFLEKNRQWNEHEKMVLSQLRLLCDTPDFGFILYDNTTLPFPFDRSVKPDAVISFLDQYIVFDAKKSKNPQAYIDTQVKKTAQKYKGNTLIYPTVFFVMPADEVAQLYRKWYTEEGFTFVIITTDSILSILLFLQKISAYEKISDFSPQDREKIVDVIAQYERHISYQNAANFVLAKQSFSLLEHKSNLPDDMQNDIQIQKNKLSLLKISPSQTTPYIKNPEKYLSEISEFLTPSPQIEKKIVDETAEVLTYEEK